MAAVLLNGFLPEDYAIDGPVGGPVGTPTGPMTGRPVEIADARALQAGAESEADFFAEHGFVLLPHVSAVRDWDADIMGVYLPEIDRLIRERLFPGRRVEFQNYPGVLRRGRDTTVPFYAEGVHSDGGIGSLIMPIMSGPMPDLRRPSGCARNMSARTSRGWSGSISGGRQIWRARWRICRWRCAIFPAFRWTTLFPRA